MVSSAKTTTTTTQGSSFATGTSATTTSTWELPPAGFPSNSTDASLPVADDDHGDFFNYILLILLYTLQGIPMGLSTSIPFLIQQKVAATEALAASTPAVSTTTAATTAKLAYQANAVFALCSWPFSLKLLWAPIVDACFIPAFGRRKSWFVPCQVLAGLLMVTGSNFVERQLGLDNQGGGSSSSSLLHSSTINVKGVTMFFFALYFLMATQDIGKLFCSVQKREG